MLWRSVLVILGVLLPVLGGACGSTSSPRGETQSEAARQARRLADMIHPPPGSTKAAKATRVDQLGFIRTDQDPLTKDVVLGWDVPLPGPQAVQYLLDHVPPGASVTQNGKLTNPPIRERQIELGVRTMPNAQVQNPRILVTISYGMSGQSGSTERVDGMVDALPPTAANSPIPDNVTSVTLTLTDPLRHGVPATAVIEGRSATLLAQDLDALPSPPGGVSNCAGDAGIRISMTFDVGNTKVANVSDGLACGGTTISIPNTNAAYHRQDNRAVFDKALADIGLTTSDLSG